MGSAFGEELSFEAVNPFIAPWFHAWCSPFQEWLRSLLPQYFVSWNGKIGGPVGIEPARIDRNGFARGGRAEETAQRDLRFARGQIPEREIETCNTRGDRTLLAS